MKFLLWLILAVISWPLALLALVLWPIIWLLGIPFRVVGISVKGALELAESIIRLPGRLIRGSE